MEERFRSQPIVAMRVMSWLEYATHVGVHHVGHCYFIVRLSSLLFSGNYIKYHLQ